MKPMVESNAWQALRRLTPARIALGRTGHSLPTDAQLEFSLAHAQARDAVHVALDVTRISQQLIAMGHEFVLVHSAATDREAYLRRPDLGRRLSGTSSNEVREYAQLWRPKLVFVVADGLSATAAMLHALPVLNALRTHTSNLEWGPIVIATQARVALGDEIGELLGAEQVVMLIGERPGLSSPDSLGLYLTHAPRIGRTDAERNCISNIRLAGLSYEQAASRLAFLIRGARRLGLSGVQLKDESVTAERLELPTHRS